MKDQNFGIEIEFTGMTRRKAAGVIAEYFGTDYNYDGGTYDAYSVYDGIGRKWKIMSDASIDCQRKERGSIVGATREYSVELVSPICKYEDIETIQALVRKLRANKGFSNKSCGIHIHINGAPHTPKSIRNFVNIIASKNDLLYKSLGIEPERMRYCKALDSRLVEEMNRKKPQTMEQIEDIWYSGYRYQSRNQHYHDSRYCFINLHSLFHGNGTVELRGYNSTLEHAGKIKAYIQLSLTMSHQALTQTRANPRVTVSTNEKYTFRTYLLRLGLIGNEFKTARQHLLDKLEGNIAWKNPEDGLKQREALRAKRLEQRQTESQAVREPPVAPDTVEIEMDDEPVQGMNLSMGNGA